MENKGFNWLKIAIEVLIIFIFVLILVWIFPMPGKNTNSNYDENFETFRSAAKSYFTVDKLPKNVGDTVRMSLDEMIEKNIIRELKDEKGKSCDVSKSYVLVSKISDTNYQLRVELSCGNETDYVLDTIGCYDTCNYTNGSTTNNQNTNNSNNGYTNTNTTINTSGTITQYRYKTQRVVKQVSYKCDEGYVLNGTKCVKSKGSAISATVQYSEEKDVYMKAEIPVGPTNIFYDDPIIEDGAKTASCPEKDGYYYDKSRDTCVKAAYSYNATPHTKTVDDSYDASATTKYTNWAYSKTITSTSAKNSTDTTKYELTGTSSKYVCNGPSDCPGLVITYTYKVYTRTTYTEYYCPNDGTLNGSRCNKSHTETYYTCDNGGDLDGTKCKVKEKTKEPTRGVEKIYTCPEGYTSVGSDMNLTCYKEVPTNGTPYCTDASYTYNKNLNKCVKHINKEIIGYTCPKDYQLVGDKCYKSGEEVNAKKWTKCIVITTYTWNSSTNLAGWTKTGETRTINK